MTDYKFIYFCPECKNTILLRSNQNLTDGEVQCLKCEVEEGEPIPTIKFKDLVIKVMPLDRDKPLGLE